MKEVKFYKLENEKEPVKEWLLSLDSSTRVKIIKRLERIYDDNFGDYKQRKSGIDEIINNRTFIRRSKPNNSAAVRFCESIKFN